MANTANQQYNDFIAAYRAAFSHLKAKEQISLANREWKLVKPTKGRNASDTKYRAKLQELLGAAAALEMNPVLSFERLFGSETAHPK